MSKLIDNCKSPHIQISFVTGLSILVLAFFSKRFLTEPIGYLPLAIPPFIATIFESVYGKYKGRKISTTWYWVVAIIVATVLVIFLSWI